MTVPDHETNARCAIEGAKPFVDWYYTSIQDGRSVASAYVNSNKTYQAAKHAPAHICANGVVVGTPDEWSEMLQRQQKAPAAWLGTTRYDVDCWDVHVINNDYRFGAPQDMVDLHGRYDGVRMMLMLSVSGTVTLGRDADATRKHFNDVFIMVPNWEWVDRRGSNSKGPKKFLVASQNYRAYTLAE